MSTKIIIDYLTESLKNKYLQEDNKYLLISSVFIGQPGNISLEGELYSIQGKSLGPVSGRSLNPKAEVFSEEEVPWERKQLRLPNIS